MGTTSGGVNSGSAFLGPVQTEEELVHGVLLKPGTRWRPPRSNTRFLRAAAQDELVRGSLSRPTMRWQPPGISTRFVCATILMLPPRGH